jgi:hypothetical protein
MLLQIIFFKNNAIEKKEEAMTTCSLTVSVPVGAVVVKTFIRLTLIPFSSITVFETLTPSFLIFC